MRPAIHLFAHVFEHEAYAVVALYERPHLLDLVCGVALAVIVRCRRRLDDARISALLCSAAVREMLPCNDEPDEDDGDCSTGVPDAAVAAHVS